MRSRSRTSDEGQSVGPYGGDTFSPTFGERTRCELCETAAQCLDRYGLTACQACHRDLLPGDGVL